ncbi:hypothetical protein PsYK624_051850 [Phanerochaete sordida]|uniref:DUF6534 domain-containing protein n=1 Tax=Phanerochaete sordida TaxID=48140 RepID=A0A9P3G6D4_9APHY|nr:hypothetical protein PsYK624_051850 [Phanerochaete sordida]
MAHDPTTLDDTIGAFELGVFADAILFGILCLQCYIFLHNNARASSLMRWSIWALWILNTGHLICGMHVTYWYTVTQFGNVLEVFEHQPRSSGIMTIFGYCSNLIVQIWFVFRIWILSERNRRLVGILGFLVGATYIIAMTFALISTIPSSLTETEAGIAKINWFIYLLHAMDILTNLLLTGVLCFCLWRAKMTTIYKTKSIVEWTLIYSVNTGLLAMLIPCTTIILRLTRPNDLVFFAVYVPYSALYSNSLLGSLNARDWIRHDEPAPIYLSDFESTASAAPHRATFHRGQTTTRSSTARAPSAHGLEKPDACKAADTHPWAAQATAPLTVKVEAETHTDLVKFADSSTSFSAC